MSGGTIYALGSGRPPAAIAIVRISGPETRFIIETISGEVADRRPALRSIRNRNDILLDRALVVRFDKPSSATGEDYAELHLHGGVAVVAAVMASLAELGARMAEPGEFTKRALLNGKLDLSAAEAVADLVDAETEMQRRIALEGALGRQAALYEGWRAEIMRLRAMIEASIDFSDEDDVSQNDMVARVRDGAVRVSREIADHLAFAERAEIVRGGFRVAIIGSPNAGKSSLLNWLAKRDVAIVSDIPGTTRDLVEVALDLGGYKIVVTDTAGLRESMDQVERIGIERALEAARTANLVLHLSERARDIPPPDVAGHGSMIRLRSKSDLGAGDEGQYQGDLAISVRTGAGLDDLVSRVAAAAASAGSGAALPLRNRHVEHLLGCKASLDMIGEEMSSGAELGAECLRRAGDALGRITGRVDVEDVLDVLFTRFCIGK